MRLPKWLRWRSNEELDEELQAHLEGAVQLNLDRGMSPEEARYAARRAVGNPTQIKERAREADPIFKLELIAKDLHYAWRGLRRNPGFTFAAVISLALGIGANTAIFSFVDAIMLRPIPVPRAGEIVRPFSNSPSRRFDRVSYREYTAYRDQNNSLKGLAAETFSPFALRARKQAVSTYGHLVSGTFFLTLEIQPLLGRTLSPADDSPSAAVIAVVLSHRIWNTAFGADPTLVGSAVRLNGQPAMIVGILPESFTGTDVTNRPQIYAPLSVIGRLFPSDADMLTNPQRRSLNLWGRLKGGVSAQSAQAEFTTIAHSLEMAYPETNRERGIGVLPEFESRFQGDETNLVLIVLLLGMVALILLVACTNVANLLLGRANARAREIAVRMSVGASRARVIAQLLTESALLAILGGGLGLLFASWGIRVLAAIPLATDVPTEFALRVDTRVLLYTATAVILSVLLFGLWPAFAATRSGLASTARGGVIFHRRRHWGRNSLVIVQTSLVAMLLIAAGLFAQTFQHASEASPGFRVDNLLLATFNPQLSGYSDVRVKEFYGELARRVSVLPGVRDIALGSHAALAALSSSQNVVPGGLDASDARNRTFTLYNLVTPGYFATTEVPLMEGRGIEAQDTAQSAPVAVVNQTLARKFGPAGNAIGQRILLPDTKKSAQIVGIARDAKYEDVMEEPTPYLYMPFTQHEQSRMTLMIHTAGDPAALAPALRATVKEFAPDVPLSEVQTMRYAFEQMGLLLPRLISQLVGVMALFGLAIGLAGLYAVVAFVVHQRTREFGIRLSLGASPGTILRGVLVSGLRVTCVGLAMGIAGATAIAGYFEPFLLHVDPHDPATYTVVSGLLLAAALAACWVPARRASLVDPAVTLRQE